MYDALEQADAGHLRPLVDTFSDTERRALIRALGLAQEAIRTAQNVQAAVKAFAADLRQSLERSQESAQRALTAARDLSPILVTRLQSVRDLLDSELHDTGIQVEVTTSTEESDTWYRAQIVETARALDYSANLSAPRFWVRLHMRRVRADLVFSFHGYGYERRAVMTCSAFTQIALEREADQGPAWHSEPTCDRPFTFSHASQAQKLRDSFTAWIDHAVQIALETFRRYRASAADSSRE